MASRIQGITVEIGGDTTKLSSALKGVNGEIRNTQSQLKDVERLLKLDPANTELLSQKQTLLAKAIGDTKDKLTTLKAASEQANKALEDGTITKDQYDALQREIIETEQALAKLEGQANNSASALEKIGTAGTKLQSAGSAVEGVGKKMTVLSTGIVAAGGASAKMAMDFEDAMAKVSTIADTTEVPLDSLEKSILELSNQTGISSTEIADNVYNAISAGQSTGDAVNFVTNSTKLAKAGFADAGSALDVLTTILNAYGLEASEVTNVSDMLIQTQNLGKTTVGELSSTMGKIIPTANAYGVELDQLCAGYAIMTANGVATAESTTYMNSMLNELGKSGTGVSDILKEKTGSSFAELMEKGYSLSDVLAIVDGAAKEQGLAFGDMWSSAEAGKAGLILLGDSAENFNGTLTKMQASTGATDTAFGKLQTNSNSIQISINQLKNTAIELGSAIMTALAPVIEKVSQKISELAKWFSGLSDEQKQTIITIAGVVAALGPALIIVGKIISAVGTVITIVPKLAGVINAVKLAFAGLNTTMLANPIFLIIAAIAALVAAFIYLWNNCDGFRQFWIDLWENIKQVAMVVWNAIKAFFQAVWEAIKVIFTTVFNVIKTLVATYFNIYKTIIQTVFNVIKTIITTVWTVIKTIFTTVFNVIKTIFVTYFNIYKTIVMTVFNAIKTIITTVWNVIKTIFTTVFNVIKTIVVTYFNVYKTIITTVFEAIKTVVTTVWNAIKTVFVTVVTAIQTFLTTAFNTIKMIITTVITAIQTVITTVVTAIQTFLTTAWNNIKLVITTVLTAIQTVFTTIWNAIKTVITTVVNTIKSVISTVWNGIKNTITSIVTGIKNTVGNVFNNILSAIRNTVGNIASTIKSGFQTAISYITSLPSQALQWGKDMIMGIVNGIKSCIGAVGDAVKSVANKITSFLHFSVPDEGPLTEYESWMPDFMQGLASGIEKSKGVVEKAVKGVATDMVISPNVKAEGNGSIVAHTNTDNTASIVGAIREAFAGINVGGGDTVIPVYIGGTMLDEIVVNAQQRMNIRSGGR